MEEMPFPTIWHGAETLSKMGDVPYSTGVTLPETNIINSSHLKNGWLDDELSFCEPYFRGKLLVLGRVPPFFGGGIKQYKSLEN